MGLVAVTTGFFAVGADLGCYLSRGWGIVLFIASFGLLFGLNLRPSAPSNSRSASCSASGR